MLIGVLILQGSDSLASWKANLFFEPAKFEVKILISFKIGHLVFGLSNRLGYVKYCFGLCLS